LTSHSLPSSPPADFGRCHSSPPIAPTSTSSPRSTFSCTARNPLLSGGSCGSRRRLARPA
uniref:Uncharacterized protein n=1 Tax=Aegilops tauschii subsp. strangulata TaxID=200361 RepID=A0A453LK26_AEGTS